MKGMVAVTHCLKWKCGGQVARMGQRRWVAATSICDVRIGERGTGATKTRWAGTFETAVREQLSRTG